MTPDIDTWRTAECEMLPLSALAAVDLLRATESLIQAGKALAALNGPSWSHPALDAWVAAVEQGRDATDRTAAWAAFPPERWWA